MTIADIGAAGRPAGSLGAANRGVLVAIGVGPFMSLLNTFALSPFLPFIARDLDTTTPLLGQIPALTMLLAAGLGFVVGGVADRIGYRRALTAGVASVAIGASVVAVTPVAVWLLLAAGINAISRSIGQPVAQAIVGLRFVGDARRHAMALLQAAGAISPILGVPILATIGEQVGWRGAFVALAGVSLVSAWIVWRWLPPDQPATPSQGVGALPAGFGVIAARPIIGGVLVATFIRNVAAWGFLTYLGAYLVERHELGGQAVGWAFLWTGVGNFAGSLAFGSPLGAAPIRPLTIGSNAVVGLILGGILLGGGPLPWLYALATIAFVALGLCNTASNTLLVDEGANHRAVVASWNQTSMSLGGAVGGSLGGLLIAIGGYEATGLAWLLCGVLAPIAVAVGSRVPATERGRRLST